MAIPVPDGVPFITGVGSVGVPVNVGEARLAFRFKAVCCVVDTGFAVSAVLSTFHSPTSHFTIPVGVVIFGEVPNTKAPLPVSSLITHFSCNDVVEAN